MRRIFSLVAVCSAAAAMALGAAPRPAAAAVESSTNFNLTVIGQPLSGDTLQLFIKTPLRATGQAILLCAPNVPPPPNAPVLPCQGGGKVYDIGWSAPAGWKVSFRFERAAADGTITVLMQGTFTTREAGPVGSQPQTFNATITYSAGTMPNTAMAHVAGPLTAALLPALGILLVLLAATMAVRRRWRESSAPISAE